MIKRSAIDLCSRAGAEEIVRRLELANPGQRYEAYLAGTIRTNRGTDRHTVWGVRRAQPPEASGLVREQAPTPGAPYVDRRPDL